MDIAIRFSGGRRSDFGDHDYEGILANTLKRCMHRIRQVCLYVEDVNGPKGGVDKQCRCVVHARGISPVIVTGKDENTEAMIQRVARRVAHALSRHADRRTARTRRTRNSQRELSS